MKYLQHLAFALILSVSMSPLSLAQSSEEEDPLAGYDELIDEIEEAEEFEESEKSIDDGSNSSSEADLFGDDFFGDLESQLFSDATNEDNNETQSSETEPTLGKTVGNRLMPKEIPEGKENHLLYNVPGAIDYRGMTFLRIDSPKFFNRFQKCDTTETDKTYNALARLKISQGAPLECRESMKYQFIPYKTFRGTR